MRANLERDVKAKNSEIQGLRARNEQLLKEISILKSRQRSVFSDDIEESKGYIDFDQLFELERHSKLRKYSEKCDR